MKQDKAQALSVKRAEVEFHSFASFGEPERVMHKYETENHRRGGMLRAHLDWIGELSPFLEIGSNVGHTSYMLANEFGADGFALDISADSLRWGRMLMDRWALERAPVRVAGDALHLPFADNSIRFVMACQMLSQFMDIEAVFLEVKRVLMPGGVFLFAEEPMRRMLSLRLYRAPYERSMKPWEKKLHEWGLLGYLVRDVIGAHQEESFGIRQNHTMDLPKWDSLVRRHFVDHRYELFVPERGWGERVMKSVARRIDKHGSEWVPARLLGGAMAAFCRKEGTVPAPAQDFSFPRDFAQLLSCPDCGGPVTLDSREAVRCGACEYQAPNEEGVYNLLPSGEKRELYPGAREDTVDFAQPGHESKLLSGFYELEGVYGNKYRWMGTRACLKLHRVSPEPQILRLRAHCSEGWLQQGEPATLKLVVNGKTAGSWTIDRSGLIVLETPVEEADEYVVEIHASPVYLAPPDKRMFSINVSMVRLVRAE